MNFLTKSLLATNIILCSLLIGTINASAAVFNFTFDANVDNTVRPPSVGSGTLSFDGAAIVGSYSLASLSNLDVNFSFIDGFSFKRDDLNLSSSSSINGISIFNSGAGNLGLAFTTQNEYSTFGFISEPNFPARFLSAPFLSFEPTISINSPITRSGGDGFSNQYAIVGTIQSFMNPGATRPEFVFIGNYNAVSAQEVPEPATILGSLTAFSFAVYSKHKSKKLLKQT
ncbi:PEP-CTERM sorting domain-containing protein [Chamaesiphon sp. OTE_75_metabat_556]|uniref:PEP-CTERM sorting domain-containing protein n=1 Tax=Chamaesiphon sp. OTE_75_metabat_556 TaxID=2964692 RepID=UPI00286CD04E|nr:PEP-CTERM sorting domain-containing protein [Chamaesiphon sp. OTE_75_metabat_556]